MFNILYFMITPCVSKDTVLALEAISKFAALISDTNNPKIDLEVFHDSGNEQESEHFETVTKTNGLVLQTIDVRNEILLTDVN